MTPESDKNLGSHDAGVALEEEQPGQATEDTNRRQDISASTDANHAAAAGSSHGQDGPADAVASKARANADSRSEDALAEGPGPDSVKKAEFQEVSATPLKDTAANLDLLLDVAVPVSVELGRTSLTVKDILSTCQGSVIELDRAAGEPVEILVGGKPLARGEVVVVKDRFGVRITELLGSIEGMTKA